MKVILLQELKGRGGEGDVIDVAQGFAVNYLLPRKIAIQATKGNLKQLEQRSHNIKVREEGRLGEANALAAALEGKTVKVSAKVGEEGRLFGSITAVMVGEAIAEQLGVEVDRRKIETHGHIKDVGPHVVDVAIYREVKSQLTVDVVPEGAPIVEDVPVTMVAEVEGIGADGEPFVEVVEETAEQIESDVALDEAVEVVEDDATSDDDAAEETEAE
jgi:large subunit ribosomal protein L9